MRNKLASLQQIYYDNIEGDIKVYTCIISLAITNESPYVMYSTVTEAQLFPA